MFQNPFDRTIFLTTDAIQTVICQPSTVNFAKAFSLSLRYSGGFVYCSAITELINAATSSKWVPPFIVVFTTAHKQQKHRSVSYDHNTRIVTTPHPDY